MNNTPLNISAKPWSGNAYPKRILAIRLQAMGDTAITLPYLQSLRNSLPQNVELDFLTRKEVDSIPRSLTLFNHVFSISGKRNFYSQCISAFFLLPELLMRKYDVVIDLQNNSISRFVRKALRVKAWSEFDKYSPNAAGERTRRSLEAVGLCDVSFRPFYTFKDSARRVIELLRQNGWDGKSKLVILNPAGAFVTRNWDIQNYSIFAKLWLADYPGTQFIAMGTKLIEHKAKYLKEKLGSELIWLVGNNSPAEGFRVIQHIQFILSEDSGLMHMCWVSDKPVVLLLGSTRSDWVTPQNGNALVLSSDDLPCGNCMSEVCRYSDVHCLTRYTPEYVFGRVKNFIKNVG